MNHIAPHLETAVAASGHCLHCGAATPSGVERYCCAGCAAAHAMIEDLGLDLYYRRRTLDPALRAPRPEEQARPDYGAFVRPAGEGTCRLDLAVDGLHCAACVWLIESVLARQPDVTAARVNMTTRRLALGWRGPAQRGAELAELVARLGYRVVPFDPAVLKSARSQADRELLRAMAVAGFAAANVMLLSVAVWAGHAQGMGPATRELMHWVSALVALPAILYAGRPFFRSALAALRARRTNMDVPIGIGVLLASGMSLVETVTGGPHAYFDSAITLLFFLLIGRYLDERARGRARGAVEHLVTLQSSSVNVLQPDGSLTATAPSQVPPGARIAVAAGERIGVDGVVREGRSDVDTALVTGETVPVALGPGDAAFGGTLNISAPLVLEVTATGEATLLAQIVRLMEAAERGRNRYVALADRVSRRYAPVVHCTAALTFAYWTLVAGMAWQPALLIAVSVLIITCPCALALAVPVAQVVASTRLMRRGTLIKSPTALERLEAVDTVVFDKTGTLTIGRPELVAEPARDKAVLQAAAALATVSRHPLAQALVRAAGPVSAAAGVEEIPGQGLRSNETRLGSRAFAGRADGPQHSDLELWFRQPGREPVCFRFRDRLREDAAETVARLRQGGYGVMLLSGDREPTVARVAREAGIDDWQAAAQPQDKLQVLAALAAAGRRCLMVGDGLNDGPALAAASVSASPSAAVDLAKNAADVVFQGDRLAPVAEMLGVARRANAIMKQNLAIALLYNLGAVPLAVLGLVTPLVAAVAMSSSSLIVIANSLRLQLAGKP
ncbi:MAG: heavy metal translocating P-type ATPase [Reyranellaceae bacterium]